MAVAAAAAAVGALTSLPFEKDLDEEEMCLPASGTPGMPEEHQCTDGYIPFSSIHKPQPFEKYGRLLYLPGHDIQVAISYFECLPDSHFLGPYLYYIQLKHCKFEWVVTKRYLQFAQLHKELTLHLARLKLPVQSQAYKEHKRLVQQFQQSLPAFPKKPDSLLRGPVELENRRRALESYLQKLLKLNTFCIHPHTLKFLEVSPLSFVQGMGPKLQEGMVQKIPSNYNTTFAPCIGAMGVDYKERWLLLKDTYVTYLRPETGRVGDVMLMDGDFNVKCGRNETGMKRGLVIENGCRKLKVQCISARKAQIWKRNIEKAMLSTGSVFTNRGKRYGSFAPERPKTPATWFVDGAAYMSAVADALEKATEEIFITDWWISPELFLKRTTKDGDQKWRLDNILKKRAEEGVQIFILIYKELPGTVAINSYEAKHTFLKINEETGQPNIHIMRHPDGITKWTHHEKCVVIDQKVAFIGGLDLCFGRWDTSEHLMFYGAVEGCEEQGDGIDIEPVSKSHRPTYTRAVSLPMTTKEKLHLHTDLAALPEYHTDESQDVIIPDSSSPRSIYYFPATKDGDSPTSNFSARLPITVKEQDSSASLPLDFYQRENDSSILPSLEIPQITALSDVKAAQESCESSKCHTRGVLKRQASFEHGGTSYACNILSAENFNSVSETTSLIRNGSTKSEPPSTPGKIPRSHSMDNKVDEKRLSRSSADIEGDRLGHLFARLRAHPNDVLCELELELEGSEDKWKEIMGGKEVPRMPWHDLGAVLYGKAARDVARHFIQRWNFTKREKEKTKHFYPMLLPKTYTQVPVPKTALSEASLCTCQVLRSSSKWSTGLDATESSIQNAYVSVILNAKHYIYIENQFFITVEEDEDVKNSIADALYKRIKQAHENQEKFRVYIVLPLMPVVEGKADGYITPAIQVICYWTYQSICRSDNSLIGRLTKAGVENPAQYVSFYALRKWYYHEEKLSTELIYVHSKLLIADDKTVILGSANINDRSLLGSRDSELAVVFNDQQFFSSKMAGKDYQAGYFAATLRRFLFKEHLGIGKDDMSSETDVKDPVIDSFYWGIWNNTANTNTLTYEKVFRCLPSNKVRSLGQMDEYRRQATMAEINPDAARQLLTQQVRGQLVVLPLDFLKDSHEDLKIPPLTAKERLVPNDVWI